MRTARFAELTKASRTRAMSSAVASRGMCQPSPNGIADGAMVCHGSCAGFQRTAALPRPLRRGLAAGMRELDAELGGADAPAMGDDARQRRLVVVGIEPEAAMGDAAVALDMGRLDDDRPAPELASMPRWLMCQSLAQPSSALYWHIGATTMRLASSRPASLIGRKQTGHGDPDVAGDAMYDHGSRRIASASAWARGTSVSISRYSSGVWPCRRPGRPRRWSACRSRPQSRNRRSRR